MSFFQRLNKFKSADIFLGINVLLLVLFGLAAILSITISAEKPDFTKLTLQLVAVALGVVLAIVLATIDYRELASFSLILYGFSFLLLGLVLFFGVRIRGTTGWFSLFGITFQPVEIVKILVIIFFANFIGANIQNMHRPWVLLKSIILIALPTLLVILQPDLGSALIFLAFFLGLILVTNIPKSYLISIGAVLVIAFILSWAFFFKAYQKERVLIFLNPSRDPLEQGYNVIQSIIAVGSGGIFGRGLGLGPQSQLNFLPEQESDFIFAVIAEELGFVGTFLVIGLYLTLFYRIFKIISVAQDDFGVLLAWGILIIFAFQALINIGMNVGLAPVAGLPLPFLSAGGSSIMANLMAIGILQSIYIHQRKAS